MDKIIKRENVLIEDMIYEIDGKEVMLDSDLAKLYNVETKRINEAVKNNPKRFPERYIMRISEEIYNSLKSINSTSKGGSRKGHTVFTEQGVYMLATILKSNNAIEVSLAIMDTFVKMRHYINYNMTALPNRFLLLENKVDENTKNINKLFDMFNPKDIINGRILFENEIYDSYSVMMDIFNISKKEIIIIDNYAGKELLDILKNINKKIIIVSKNIDEILKNKYESQYNNVKFINNDSFHDRFIIIDKKRLFVCGSSLKDFGKKCFGIYSFDDNNYLKRILDEIKI